MSDGGLKRERLDKMARVLSVRWRYWYSRRNLYHELERRGRLDGLSGEAGLEQFGEQLASHERVHGPLRRLVRPEQLPAPSEAPPLPEDIFDYAVRRVLVFQRLDPLMVFARSRFHQKMVVAMVTAEGFPEHVWGRLRGQLDAGLSTTFYAVHDCTPEGYAMAGRLREQLASWDRARVADVGMGLSHTMELGVPLRSGPAVPLSGRLADDPDEQQMLAEGSHAYFEELRPIQAMRWVYRRLVRRSEDEGFG